MDKNCIYKLEFLVRDYECDLQGIVNNAVYQNYLEHTRHEFMQSADVDFAKLHDEGIDPVVIRVELDYKYPLKSQDNFIVCINLHREGRLRFVFDQTIYRLSDEQIMLNGKITAVFLKNGRPVKPDNIIGALLEKYNVK
ncbi:MAG: acyl-CoA thioesterase [Spirochaetales bacterium]|nr:acyl-CoA thioesterase [Spirochaetales bacterium]